MRSEIILNMNVHLVSLDVVLDSICTWAAGDIGRYVCVSNVHMCMEVYDDPIYRNVVNGADLTVPDGVPLVWGQKLLGHADAAQVRGADLTLAVCAEASDRGISVGFFGSSREVLNDLEEKLTHLFPNLEIVYSESPPFRPMTEEEDVKCIEEMNSSSVGVLFVGLGCPKQEIWMSDHKHSLNCTMLGVGAAFDFIAGNKKDAPRWLRRIGLEWFFRFLSEPRRLWKRYLKNNPRFVYLFICQLLGKKYE